MKKTIKLIDFSIQEVSTGQVDAMLAYLSKRISKSFDHIMVKFMNNEYGDTRCYLTINISEGTVIQWFKDRNPAQIEDFTKSFKVEDRNYILKKTVTVDADELEHLLNCMDNQKFIHEQDEETKKEWQNIIDTANRNMRKVLSEVTKNGKV